MFADGFAKRLRFDVDRKCCGELPCICLYKANTVSGKLDLLQIEHWLRVYS